MSANILVQKGEDQEIWTTLADFCKAHDLKVNTFYRCKFPIERDGFILKKIPVNKKLITK